MFWQKIGLLLVCTIFVQVSAKRVEMLNIMGVARSVTSISLELEKDI